MDSAQTGGIDPIDQHWRGRWIHWIDSRTEDCTDVVDEGKMYPLPPQNDEPRCLEKGRMVNPATGVETDYEEVWRTEHPNPSVPGQLDCMVLDMDTQAEDGTKKQGRIIRLGHYIQGFVRVGDQVFAERRSWDQSGGEWRVDAKIGNGIGIPMDFIAQDTNGVDAGLEVKLGDAEDIWKVVEKVTRP